MARYASVALPIPGKCLYTYATAPEYGAENLFSSRSPKDRQTVEIGQQVLVSFALRKTMLRGFVVALSDETDLDPETIKPIERVLTPQPALTEGLLALADWIARYYCCSLGEVLAAIYPFRADVAPKTREIVRLASGCAEQLRSQSQQRVFRILREDPARTWTRSALAQTAGVSLSVIGGLLRKGFLTTERMAARPGAMVGTGVHAYERPVLTSEQRKAFSAIQETLDAFGSQVFLLHGVTGSGKTEVYMNAIEHVLNQGRTAMVLVPEIGLTPQALDRYHDRFGSCVGLLHSGLSDSERYNEWWRVRRGEVRVLIGTRSAVLAPLADLGLCIVDEEHDASYKQDDPAPRYHARDVAVYRAYVSRAVVLLGSATPSLESYTQALRGKYRLLSLPQRIVGHGLPPVTLVDHRGRPESEHVLTKEMAGAIAQRLERHEQVLLLLNRRGYSAQVLCGSCGGVVMCHQCSIPMAYHRTRETLLCHHCDSVAPVPSRCPECDEPFVRMRGIGTQQVVHAVEQRFAGVRVGRMDTDAARSRHAPQQILHAFRNGDLDILVGTQMVAKGLDIPGVTLVGVINADAGLILPDFRAAERAFALLTQVAGRAGRGATPGEVLIQTYCPNHYSVTAAVMHDYALFYQREMRFRRAVRFPPYSRLVLVRTESRQEPAVAPAMEQLQRTLRASIAGLRLRTIRIIGPAEAPIYQLHGRYRWQLVLASHRPMELHQLLRDSAVELALQVLRTKVKVIVNVDPATLL